MSDPVPQVFETSKGLTEGVQVFMVAEIGPKGLVSRLDRLAVRFGEVKAREQAQLLLKLGQFFRRKGRAGRLRAMVSSKRLRSFRAKSGLLVARGRSCTSDDGLDGRDGRTGDEDQFQVERPGQLDQAGESQVDGPLLESGDVALGTPETAPRSRWLSPLASRALRRIVAMCSAPGIIDLSFYIILYI